MTMAGGKNEQTLHLEGPRQEDHARVLLVDAEYGRLEPALEKVINGLDLASFLAGTRGKRVFIKPNMLGVFPPDRHAATNPALVRAVVKLFRDAGAEVLVGDNCGAGSYGLNRKSAKVTGIEEAADGAYVNVAQDTVQVPLKTRFLDAIAVSRAMLTSDYLVSLPKLKTHSLTVVTGAVKNMFGLVAGAGKSLAHSSAPGNKDFGEMLAGIYSIRPPDLTIMDAVVAMEGNGPSAGKPRPLNKLLASQNAVALDAVMCRIMDFPPEEVHHLRVAARKGWGPLAPEAIELIGELPQTPRFKLPVTFHRLSCLGRFVNEKFYTWLTNSKLTLDTKRCQKCKICVTACPSGAMKMDDFPRIEEDKCIRCLCCHELCPESAWTTRGFFGQFMLRGRMGLWKSE